VFLAEILSFRIALGVKGFMHKAMSTNNTIALHMVKIPVSDVSTAVGFYRDVIGLSEDFVVTEYGWAQLSAGDFPIALYESGKGGGKGVVGGCDSLHFRLNDLSAITQRLTDAGFSESDILHQGNDGSTFLEINDPDGNTIKVMLVTA
jgi:predicted enzyme related to lactoylglutathione lyase